MQNDKHTEVIHMGTLREINENTIKIKRTIISKEYWGKSGKFVNKRWNLSRELKVLWNASYKGYDLNS